MKRKVVSILTLCALLLSALCTSASAALPEQVSPLWENTFAVDAQIAFEDGIGYIGIAISGKTGVTNIYADITLSYKNDDGRWIIMEEWGHNSPGMTFGFDDTFEATAGVEYKLYVSAIVTKGNVDELIEKTATVVCPSN